MINYLLQTVTSRVQRYNDQEQKRNIIDNKNSIEKRDTMFSLIA